MPPVPPESQIAERLNWLFENVTKADGSVFTHQEVEDGTALLGCRVTTTTIWSIRRGKTPNPGILTLRAIARFFNVNSEFFTRETLNAAEQALVQQEAVPADPTVAEITWRTAQMDERRKQAILNMVRLIAHEEGHGNNQAEG